MQKLHNNRVEAKIACGFGGTSYLWFGKHIKEFRYQNVPLMRWYSQQKKIVFFDYQIQLDRMDLPYYYKRTHRAQTIRYKYMQFLPPGIDIMSRRGRKGGFSLFIGGITSSKQVDLEDGLVLEYDGVL